MVEVWKDVPGYDGKYQATTEGVCRGRYRSGRIRILKPYYRKVRGGRKKRLVVKLIDNEGKGKEVPLIQLMAKTFLGPVPDGHIPYHKNGCEADNYIQNIAYISRVEAGKIFGPRARRKSVVKIDEFGEIVEVYSSAREAGRRNFMSYQTVMDRCNGKCKGAFAPDGYAYAWDNSEVSMRNAIAKIEKETGFMPKAHRTEFDF